MRGVRRWRWQSPTSGGGSAASQHSGASPWDSGWRSWNSVSLLGHRRRREQRWKQPWR
jgi:hypothetical protein